jgi:hypothetical protein
MAKIKKRRFRWCASASPSVIGYKLYWEEQGEVGYHSNCAFIGNVTEVVLPDQAPSFPLTDGSIELGISAVNEIGNESDLVTFTAPFQFSVPLPPSGLSLEAMAECHVTASRCDLRYQETLEKLNPEVAENKDLLSVSEK